MAAELSACAASWTSASRSRTWCATRNSSRTCRSRAGSGVIIRAQKGEAWLALFVIPAGPQYLMLVRDVTREVRLSEMRKDFVANASHELRSPLTVISGYLDELAEDAASDRNGASRSRTCAARPAHARDRRGPARLSRLEATTDEAPMAPVDAGAPGAARARTARGVPGAALRARDRRQLHASRKRDGASFDRVEPDLERGQVHAADGTITIRWVRESGGAQLVVRDTGIGIAPEHLPRLTERFYRVDRARARAKGGSGLGLSIVKHGLQRHGGRLEISSEEGRGSIFTAHFPSRRVIARSAAAIKAS
jgi:two-component system phosphate regulon sensor histidine kinase PhoR